NCARSWPACAARSSSCRSSRAASTVPPCRSSPPPCGRPADAGNLTSPRYARMVVADQPAGPWLDVDAILADPGVRIVVCCGSGGVGKTTTAAALALRAAEKHGRLTVVLTIDPARRLAQALGLTELDNTPRPVKGTNGDAGGELHAMMLDMKRTFDDVVLAHTDPKRAEEIFANPFYQ